MMIENHFIQLVKSYPWPSVIRISKFVKLPYKKVVLTRKNILDEILLNVLIAAGLILP
jgi:hypothetical protein